MVYFFFPSCMTFLYHTNIYVVDTSREQTFNPQLKWALFSVFFAPGTRETFSPGWWIQPGLNVPVQRLLRQTEVAGTFSPGWSHQPGLKVDFYSRLVAPTGSKGLLPGRGLESYQPGLKVPLYIPAVSFLPEPELSTSRTLLQ